MSTGEGKFRTIAGISPIGIVRSIDRDRQPRQNPRKKRDGPDAEVLQQEDLPTDVVEIHQPEQNSASTPDSAPHVSSPIRIMKSDQPGHQDPVTHLDIKV